jgi:methylated-DNA-[protein]-cysteine S-methyltransferase
MKIAFRQTAIGRIGIGERAGEITNLFFEGYAVPEDAEIRETDILREAFRQLEAWLAGELREFSLPLDPDGTPFMKQVWGRLQEIPCGSTATYGAIAAASGNPGAARAVGMACNRNPIPLFIPCHRVVGSGGRLTGFRGGLPLKERLLELERLHSAGAAPFPS